MKIQSILLAGVLSLASVGMLSAKKSYEIALSTPIMAGNVQLPAGEYRVKVEGDNAVFNMVDQDKTFTAPVKMESVMQKYDQTAVVSTTKDGTDRIESIELGGSKTKLDFSK